MRRLRQPDVLARANEGTPPELFEKVFQALLARCQAFAPPKQKFHFKDGGKVYLLDATVIELPLSLFSRASCRTGKGAVKMHVGVSADAVDGRASCRERV